MFKQSNQPKGQAKALFRLGLAAREQPEKERCFTESIRVAKQIRWAHGEACALLELGVLTASQPFITKARAIFESFGDDLQVSRSSHYLQQLGLTPTTPEQPVALRAEDQTLGDLLEDLEHITEISTAPLPASGQRDSSLLDLLAGMDSLGDSDTEPGKNHSLEPNRLSTVVRCSTCSKMIWGIQRIAVQCSACPYVAHKACGQVAGPTCPTSIEHLAIDFPSSTPQPHQFMPWNFDNPTFCHACTKFIPTGGHGLRCAACAFVAHDACAEHTAAECIFTGVKSRRSPHLRDRFIAVSRLPPSPSPAASDVYDLNDLLRLLLQPVRGVTLVEAQLNLTTCLAFTGADLVDWLLWQDLPAVARADAVLLGTELLRHHYIAPLSPEQSSRDLVDSKVVLYGVMHRKRPTTPPRPPPSITGAFVQRVALSVPAVLERHGVKAASGASVVKQIIQPPNRPPFVIKEYQPAKFHELRSLVVLDTGAIRAAFVQPLSFVSYEEGGAGVFRTHDDAFHLQTLTRSQHAFLVNRMDSYMDHVKFTPTTLLRIVGLFELQSSPTASNFFVVYANPVPPGPKTETTQALRGSTDSVQPIAVDDPHRVIEILKADCNLLWRWECVRYRLLLSTIQGSPDPHLGATYHPVTFS